MYVCVCRVCVCVCVPCPVPTALHRVHPKIIPFLFFFLASHYFHFPFFSVLLSSCCFAYFFLVFKLLPWRPHKLTPSTRQFVSKTCVVPIQREKSGRVLALIAAVGWRKTLAKHRLAQIRNKNLQNSV